MFANRRIALLLGQDLDFCRNLIRGIRAYALKKRDWTFRSAPCDMQIVPLLRDWKPDGIIANLFDKSVADAVIELGIPIVDTAFTLKGLSLPVVDVDHSAVGRIAAEYFLQRKYQNFGFLGSGTALYSNMREAGYTEVLSGLGHDVSKCYVEYLSQASKTTNWNGEEKHTQKWLKSLPKPAAIFACNDVPARELADTCRQMGLRVPEEVAILGVDNDGLICLLAHPPLSSVAIPAKQIGYEVAALLDQIMHGEPVPKEPRFLPPIRVVTRQSTDTLAIDNPIVLTAVKYIRSHSSENIGVNTVATAIGVSRRELERAFRLLLNCSVLEEIRRVRVEHTKELLSATSLPMPAIAKQVGFSGAQRMAVVFGQVAGMSPTAYRSQYQLSNTYTDAMKLNTSLG